MKFRNTKLSKRTIALLAAAVVMFASGGTVGTRAALNVTSDNYDATIATDRISVQLTENGDAVDNGGKLYEAVGEKVEPSRTYDDTVGVHNDGEAPEYVRVLVRKYWTDKDGNKTTALKPEMIETKLADGWIEKDGGSDETAIYYLKNQLPVGEDAVLFENLSISKDVMANGEGKTVDSKTEDGKTKTVITYTYEYDGYTFNVEAEAQSVQTHHASDAIKSVWGVNASVSGDSITGIN